ncbi:MAG: phosphate ABC transporter permease subunit PstC, partial [Thaumarchaeota archaeon]|nr:phosphate ABC transporter permease subunit PstC [Nitrososphaerota archaeon]
MVLINKKPARSRIQTDKIFKIAATVAGAYVLVVIVLMISQLYSASHLIWEREGLSFITGSDWNAVQGRESFGAAPYILGTLVTAGLAMTMGVPISIGIAMFISQAPKVIASPLAIVIDL